MNPPLVYHLSIAVKYLKPILKINATGVPIFIVEQNAKQALGIANRGYVLVDGSNRFTGTGAELLADREVARMFLGGRD